MPTVLRTLRAENERLRAKTERMRKVLEWLDWRGGLGYDAHDRIAVALDKEPKNGTQ